MIFDLSHPITTDTLPYPGTPAFKIRAVISHGEQKPHYAPGTSFQIAGYEFGGNIGTYVDSPFHRHPGGADFVDLPLDRLANLPGVVVPAPANGPIDAGAFQKVDVKGKAVLVFTGWAARWGSPDYFRSGPFLTAGACQHLIAAGATLVGIDCANIDNMQDGARPAHTLLLAAGIPVVEHLRGLEQIGPRGFRFTAAPPAIRGGTSFPVRAFAVCE
jgi:arylformamidase